MSNIDMTFRHGISNESATSRINNLFETLKVKSAYFENVEPIWSEDGSECSFRGEGFSGRISLNSGEARFELELQGIMAMFRPVVEEKLRELMEKEFPQTD